MILVIFLLTRLWKNMDYERSLIKILKNNKGKFVDYKYYSIHREEYK